MFEVRSRFNRPVSSYAPVGDGMDVLFEERIVDGVKKLVKTGVNPLNEFVQKSLEDTLIYNILKKFEAGNVDVLNKSIGQFFDSTVMPHNLAEAQNSLIKAEAYFDSLPLDVRNKFDNSSSTFFQSVFDGSYLERAAEFFNPDKKIDVKEPTEDVS